MKKNIMSIAIAAMIASSIVACTGTTETTNESNDSTATEQTEPKEVKIEDQTELECDHYVLKVPENWKASSRMVNSSCVLNVKGSPFTTASANFQSSTSIDTYKADLEKNGAKALDPITSGDVTFVVYEKPDNDGKPMIYAATPKGDGVMTLRLFNGAHMMDEAEAKDALMNNVKTIIEHVTLK